MWRHLLEIVVPRSVENIFADRDPQYMLVVGVRLFVQLVSIFFACNIIDFAGLYSLNSQPAIEMQWKYFLCKHSIDGWMDREPLIN